MGAEQKSGQTPNLEASSERTTRERFTDAFTRIRGLQYPDGRLVTEIPNGPRFTQIQRHGLYESDAPAVTVSFGIRIGRDLEITSQISYTLNSDLCIVGISASRWDSYNTPKPVYTSELSLTDEQRKILDAMQAETLADRVEGAYALLFGKSKS